MQYSIKPLARLLGLCLTLLLLAACASNEAVITNSWMAKDIRSKQDLEGVLVLAISKKAETRQRFERAFTDRLVQRGVRAVASYELNNASQIKKADVVAMAKSDNLDTVLVTSFAGRDQQEVLHPGRTYYGVAPVYSPTGGYYGRGGVYGVPFEVAHVPDFYAQHISIHLEANLYEVSTAEHLWQAASGITESQDNREMLDSFIDAFVEQLQKDQLVR
ncbi:MAG: hypothetical protein ABJ308_06615 [Halieaceae bacterium]